MDKTGSNARGYRRILSFILDVFFVNFIKSLLTQLFIFSRSNIVRMQEFMNNFRELFGTVDLTRLKDFHIRYIANNSKIFEYIFYVLLIVSLSGVVYSFLCTVFLNSATFGQKIMSLKVVDAKRREKPSAPKLFLRSVVAPLPMTFTFLIFVSFGLGFLNFHLYVPENSWPIIMLCRLTDLSSHYYLLATLLAFFMIFWYGLYYISDRLIFSDFISSTRVIEVSKYGENLGSTDRDFVYFGDKLIGLLERANVFLFGLLRKAIGYLGSKFRGRSGGDRTGGGGKN
ncbi:MAG: RDD family protein [Rickettsiales bacterium]|jgi:hypothetical protein|nr:RDD family protein [Rickettsiales bacterium]